MRITLISAVLAATFALPVAAADSYKIDATHTYPSFEVSHLGFSIQRGRFDKSDGKIVLDKEGKSTIDITIDAASVNTGFQKRDDHLRAEDFFNVAKFPTITFKSSKLNYNGSTLTSAEGDLTMLGVTKPVTLDITNFKCGVHPMNKKDLCGAAATASVKRSDFGMKYGLPAIGDDIKIAIQIEAFKE